LGLNVLSNDTLARLEDSQLEFKDDGDLKVHALSGGSSGALGLGMSVNTGSNSTASVAGSASVTVGVNNTEALLDSAIVTGHNGNDDQTEVVAYNHDNIASG